MPVKRRWESCETVYIYDTKATYNTKASQNN
jgi:hypothetical protein